MERAVKVDYLSFTTRRPLPVVCVLFLYLKNPLKMEEKGLHGYKWSMSSSDGVTVLFSHDRADIHVQLSGHGCNAELDTLLGLVDVKDHVTRLDIALDCIGSGFTCGQIWGLLQRGEYLAGAGDIRHIEGLLPSQGHTIYIGASASERMVRIYDKGVESKTGIDWLRFEVQLRGKSADKFWLVGCKGGKFLRNAMRLLNKQIRIIFPGHEKLIEQRNYSRVVLHPFWAELTDSQKPFSLKLPKSMKTISSTLRYVKNCGSALKCLKGAMTDYDEFIHGVVADAVLKPHHVQFQDDLNDRGVSQADQYYDFLLNGEKEAAKGISQ